MTDLDRLWAKLRRVRHLSFVAASEAGTGWDGRGEGAVEVEEPAAGVLIFREAGVWRSAAGREWRFTNVFRWSVVSSRLRLEHLRLGPDDPVHLFDLAAAGGREWRPVSPHVCRADCYIGVLTVGDDRLALRWTVAGPKKRETIEYTYSWPGAGT